MSLGRRLLIVAFLLLGMTAAYLAGAGTVVAVQALRGTPVIPQVQPLERERAGELGEAAGTPQDLKEDFQPFWEAWDLLWQEYYRRDELDRKALIQGAIQGLMEATGDPYTFYSTPEENRIAQEDMSGEFEGIGAYIEVDKEGRLLIVSPIKDTPADRAGLKPGDQIVAIDGESTEGITIMEAVLKIRGPKGTKVTLTIYRASEDRTFDVEIVRDRIPIVTVNYEMLDDGIAYVQITQFGARTTEELDRALKELLKEEPKGLILDLRNNPGGFLRTAQEVLGRFLPEDALALYERFPDEDIPRKVIPPVRGKAVTDLPMVVLINEGSASASEIVAGALQDHGRATLVGVTSFGKGTVQNVHDLSDGSSVRITIAEWLTPEKRSIQDVGITPDVEVPLPEDLQEGEDPQLDRALQILRSR